MLDDDSDAYVSIMLHGCEVCIAWNIKIVNCN